MNVLDRDQWLECIKLELDNFVSLNQFKEINMDHKSFQFKTNINCGGCISAVKPHLDRIEGIAAWSVDTDNPDKILTVQSSGITEAQIIETVQNAGFKIESVA